VVFLSSMVLCLLVLGEGGLVGLLLACLRDLMTYINGTNQGMGKWGIER
jgi:hypothetical protein